MKAFCFYFITYLLIINVLKTNLKVCAAAHLTVLSKSVTIVMVHRF